ncbi:AAA family ATPase [Lactobacillus gasseri]|jgi:phage-associated ATPase|uniref:NTP-binding protein n=1 Tax=Lactobacillus gasseri TaxID=1596 RepID=A0AB33C9P6_LACGS|nr:AAA family ATPase [Lactobacillus gasseri]DAS87085.1 MAG TPA: AAA domain protein [Caudoviricetes sp.]ART97467.1 hypothetical protein CCE30_00380 [Lactobacillus gasseri]MBW0438347.1 AAA family ATPase [Lactobacillus gasseri]MCT7703933.1 ATP-binding protein [Lactobacillus gasseri]QTP20507.1 AAA family ATPase [Lactobacillus gasseri]
MIRLPEDKPIKPKKEPKYYFIYGEPMSGKTFFASYFPHVLDINTDNNASQSRAPSIQLLTDENGQPVYDIIGRLDEIIKLISKSTFKTIVIDTIEDVVSAVTKQITDSANEKYITDGKLAYGKGSSMVKKVIEDLVLELKSLPVNVIWISREEEQNDIAAGTSKIVPALKTKYYNIVAGNCDLVIRTSKTGDGQNTTYYRQIKSRRSNYIPQDITNPQVRNLLASCMGMFTREQMEELKNKKEK